LKLLKEMSGKKNRRARFKTVICLILNNETYFFEGIINGKILTEQKGEGGFGYDPVFLPDNYDLTLAEMTAEQKNSISHRALATKKLSEFLKTNP
jgi:XTP/dITP diphosphohydrolase